LIIKKLEIIEHSLLSFLMKPIRVFIKVSYRQLTNQLRRSESRLFGLIIVKLSLSIANLIKIQKIPYALRQIISLAQPSDPLRGTILPTIDIVIPCHIKDFENLPLVIQGAKAGVSNPIGEIKLITPEYLSIELQIRFPDCLDRKSVV
jgi:hypothetical protein